MPRYNPSELKEYCLQFYRELKHPFTSRSSSTVNVSDIEAAVDVLDGILNIQPTVKAFSGLRDQFYAAFGSYLTLPRDEIASLCVAVDKLSALIDPFLKKVAFVLLPKKKVGTRQGNTVPLWKTSNYVDVLAALGITKTNELYKTSSSYWQSKPAEVALLRCGFTARQKSVHESRIRNLEELEKTVYAIIGTYIIVCLNISKSPLIHKQFAQIVERRRTTYLFEERVRSFPITRTLLSRKEHLLVYKHRSDISPDIEGRKFLFVSYLAGRGPCFFWFKREDKEILMAWAKELFKNSADEVIKTTALRFLIENAGGFFKLQTLVNNF